MKRPDRNKFTMNQDINRKSDTHPTHRGVLDVEGKLYWIGGWHNGGNYGTYFKGDVREVTQDEIAKYFSNNSTQPASRSVAPPPLMKPPVLIYDDSGDELPF